LWRNLIELKNLGERIRVVAVTGGVAATRILLKLKSKVLEHYFIQASADNGVVKTTFRVWQTGAEGIDDLYDGPPVLVSDAWRSAGHVHVSAGEEVV
jgi:hypothetical protein